MGEGDTMELKAEKHGTLYASKMTGPAFKASKADALPLLEIGQGQELDVVIHFEENCGRKHARFCPCAAVGMQKLDNGRYRIEFEMLHPDRDPQDIALQAIGALESQVDVALEGLSDTFHQVPKTHC
jgi:hypothetical protein